APAVADDPLGDDERQERAVDGNGDERRRQARQADDDELLGPRVGGLAPDQDGCGGEAEDGEELPDAKTAGGVSRGHATPRPAEPAAPARPLRESRRPFPSGRPPWQAPSREPDRPRPRRRASGATSAARALRRTPRRTARAHTAR